MRLQPEHFRRVIHRHGETVLWYRATPNPANNPGTNDFDEAADDTLYTTVSLSSSVKVLITQAQREYIDRDFGAVQKGDLFLTTMPDEVRIGAMDKVVLSNRTWETKERHVKGTSDTLQFTPVVSVTEIRDESHGVIETARYAVNLLTGAITFNGTPIPAMEATYTVTYLYRPTFWYIGAAQSGNRPAPGFGEALPQRGMLSWKRPGGEE
ncbi:hypothetical protein COT23_01420 [Candidatus Kaiserbacteria bacterium CG08_land_8_20_14_0_20_50_21]|uniref:Uncharacterized protein n=2 Tax=Candidatus Kaiseribacteriota TaxID=1752734 RepID=A0A2H0YY50_9BACT|nr:MAG: hypothetical protein COT23_01420 [Candidatus Kaiserbacteria bacterium CG08_land_8_20_14_0_20_50_21]